MEAYYRDEMTVLYNGDCITGLAELPEGLYDLVLTSPPYHIGKEYEERQSYGEYLKLLSDFITEGFRIINKGGYLVVVYADYYVFAGQYSRVIPMEYLYHIIAERAGWVHQCTRVWQKDYATLSDPYTISGNLPKLEAEHISTFRKPGGGKEKVREQTLHGRQIWDTTGKRQEKSTLKLHTAAFPEDLVAKILTVYTDPGDTVVDPFMGSGTTLYIAKRMGRKSVGFEIDTKEGYCKTAAIRLSQQVFDIDRIRKCKQFDFTVDESKIVVPDTF